MNRRSRYEFDDDSFDGYDFVIRDDNVWIIFGKIRRI